MRNYLVALCVLLLAGCTKADVETISHHKINSQKFHAEFAEEDTRTFVDEKVRLLWTEGDLLTIFTSTLNRKYQFDGETGENSGTFSEIATSQFGTGNSISTNYAIYPYASSNKINNDEVITVSLPATQNYAENSFGQNANTMVAVTSGTNDLFLPFKNLCGFLRLSLYGEGITVSSIQLQGNNSEKIAGKATVVAQYGKTPELEMSDDATETITLDCGDGIELGATAAEATDFWIVVPPTTFTQGFKITITDTDGAIMEKATSKNYVVERNVLKSMSAFEVETRDANTPPNNQIWYTTDNGAVVSLGNVAVAFGATTIISNVYEYGKGIITFDKDINKIGNNAFSHCEHLTGVTIPDSVEEIGKNAFTYTRLANIILSDNVSIIGEYAFANSALTNITIPESVTEIEAYTFYGCTKLTDVSMHNGITSIGPRAFYGCESLNSITLPNGLNSIGDYSFFQCSKLTNITIPDNVISIEEAAFSYCFSLKAFYGKFASSDRRCLIIEDKLIAFAPSGLTEYTIPSYVTSISKYVFYKCDLLGEIEIPEDVISIGDFAFSGCSDLYDITIPAKVVSIGTGAFRNCSNLTRVWCLPQTPPSLSAWTVFNNNASTRKIYIFPESLDAYQNATHWSYYADAFEAVLS